MALLFMDSFDSYAEPTASSNVADYIGTHWDDVTSDGGGIRIAEGRYGGGSLRVFPNNNSSSEINYLRAPVIPFDNGATEVYIGFNFKLNSSDIRRTTMKLFSTDAWANTVSFEDNIVTFFKSGGYGDGSVSVPGDEWHHLEIQLIKSGSNFTRNIYYDGNLVREGSILHSVTANYIEIYSNIGFWQVDIDDFYILDNSGSSLNTLLGPDARIECLRPLTTHNGNNWLFNNASGIVDAVDDYGYDTDKNIETPNSGTSQEFNYESVENIIDVKGLQLRNVVKSNTSEDLDFYFNGQVVDTLSLTNLIEGQSVILHEELSESGVNSITSGFGTVS